MEQIMTFFVATQLAAAIIWTIFVLSKMSKNSHPIHQEPKVAINMV